MELRWQDVTLPDDELPQEGDAVVCCSCGCTMVFTADLQFRYPTVAEAELMDEDERIQHLIKTAREMRQ
jgi:hypothetical protein